MSIVFIDISLRHTPIECEPDHTRRLIARLHARLITYVLSRTVGIYISVAVLLDSSHFRFIN